MHRDAELDQRAWCVAATLSAPATAAVGGPSAAALWGVATLRAPTPVHLVAPREVAGAVVHANERVLLEAALSRLRELDPDVIVGWNVVDFDLRTWVARCEALGTSAEELTRREHLRQAADQVSVGNAITSMRAIAALDWTQFFELTSSVEEILRKDPCGAYEKMDQPSRDRCRHQVEQLARRSRTSEEGVAGRALSLAQDAQVEGQPLAARHVGYYLLGAGRRRLERDVGYRPKLGERLRRPVLGWPLFFYLGASAMVFAFPDTSRTELSS